MVSDTYLLIFQICLFVTIIIMCTLIIVSIYCINIILPGDQQKPKLVTLGLSFLESITKTNTGISIIILFSALILAIGFKIKFAFNDSILNLGKDIFPETVGLLFDALILVFFYNILLQKVERKKEIEKYEELLDELRVNPEMTGPKVMPNMPEQNRNKAAILIRKLSNLKQTKIRLSYLDLSGCDLSNINFTGSNFFRTNLVSTKLINCIFTDVGCSESNFENSILGGIKINGNSRIQFSKFNNAYMRNCELRSISLYSCEFNHVKLEKSTIIDCTISECTFNHAEVSENFISSTKANNIIRDDSLNYSEQKKKFTNEKIPIIYLYPI